MIENFEQLNSRCNGFLGLKWQLFPNFGFFRAFIDQPE